MSAGALGSPRGHGVTAAGQQAVGSWEPNSSLQEQQTLLNTEQSLQPAFKITVVIIAVVIIIIKKKFSHGP